MDDLDCTGLLDYWFGQPELYWTTGLLEWMTWNVLDYWNGQPGHWTTGLLEWTTGLLEWTIYWSTGMTVGKVRTFVSGQDQSSMYIYMHAERYW